MFENTKNGHFGNKRGTLGPFDQAEIPQKVSNSLKSANFDHRCAFI